MVDDEQFKDLEAGENTALIKKDGDDSDAAQAPSKFNIKENAVKGAAVVATGSSVGAMLFVAHNPLILVSGGIGAMVAPYAAVQETKITELEALKAINESLTKEVDALSAENDRLMVQMKELESSVSSFEEMEEALQAIKKTESSSVEEMENNLEKSKKILDSMETNMKATVLQNIISTVLRADSDGDHYLDDDEITVLFQKLDAYDSVKINEVLFRQVIIEKGRSLNGIMAVVKTILTDDIPDEEQIIQIIG